MYLNSQSNGFHFSFISWHMICLQLGGPSWKVHLGRRDSTTANKTAASTFIPPPTSKLSTLLSSYAKEGLSLKNLVALSGN